MANIITFGSTTIWDCSLGGTEFAFSPTSISTTVIEKQAPIGNGYFLKKKGKEAADSSLELKYLTDDPQGIINLLEGIDPMFLGTLSLPRWGSFDNYRLISPGSFSIETWSGEDPIRYLLVANLNFRRYP
jgi:hypothetical protein